jgi:NifU-like protein involved in Fe-S cluster formation
MDDALRDLYSQRLLALAARSDATVRLTDPDVTATVENRLCGSRIIVDMKVTNGIIIAYGHRVRACIIGQAAASLVASIIVGRAVTDVQSGRLQLLTILRQGAAPPTRPWQELEVFTPLHDHPARHASALLPFDAVGKALSADFVDGHD